jgi:hypothetical protein
MNARGVFVKAERNEKCVIGHWRKGESCKEAENLPELFLLLSRK